MKSKSNISNNIPQKGRRVFISFIGTNNYKWTYYSFGEEWKSPKPVRFIQEALISMLCADWTEKDQIYIFRTEKARVLNWIDKPDVTGLESTLRQMDLKVPFKDIEIKEGFSEKDVWDIFNSIYSQLQPDDQIYLDVTHAFRSIPMFSTILFNYSKMMLHTETRAIYYGAFEKMGSGPEVDKIPVEKRDAPILDLSNFVYLQDITSAANNFIKYGNLQATSDILKDIERGVTFDKQAHKLKFNDLSFALLDFSGEMDTCRGSIIQSGATVKKIRSRINSFLDLPIPDPIKDILKAVMQKMNAFSSEPTLDNVVEAIWWCSQNGMMQQAYTLAEEYIITVATDLLKTYLDPIIVEEDEKKKQKKIREFSSSILGMNDLQVKDLNSWTGIVADYKAETLEFFNLSWIMELRKEYCKLQSNRNDLNHGGFLDNKTPDVFKRDKSFKGPFSKCISILNNEKAQHH